MYVRDFVNCMCPKCSSAKQRYLKSYIVFNSWYIIIMRTYQCTTFNSLRLREHVEDASKNPILIFPEGEWILDASPCYFCPYLVAIFCAQLTTNQRHHTKNPCRFTSSVRNFSGPVWNVRSERGKDWAGGARCKIKIVWWFLYIFSQEHALITHPWWCSKKEVLRLAEMSIL